MKQTIDYSALTEPAKKQKALNDVKAYLGPVRFDGLTQLFHQHATHFNWTCDDFAIACSFAGIEGYPVTAFYEHVMNKPWTNT